MSEPSVWCPSCGAEYRAGALTCSDCRVALVTYRPDARNSDRDGSAAAGDDSDSELIELGEWPRLEAQILRRRLESAGVSVMIEWSSTAGDATGTVVVPGDQADFAWAVVQEVPVADEVPDTSPHAYVAQIEEHLSAAAGLLEELRTRLDQVAQDGA